ncbi:helix-turn-helix domain-containing protein [Luteibacter aegosomatissinici]|uniref:helix-turn-helix domain-containing protein n=1 Tax=Luteibacter aegosomatissinici TaxID=2911539 RepID=UPI001FFB3DC8|nr:AraC family transcriptional regulator [Luteibacter aegosomatissinici]UPG95165.1 AraC family transcriptional regulator [Luteibacter aegosomatissinici]
MARYTAGDVGAPLEAPQGAIALRFPFGRCRISVHAEGRWMPCGEAAAGYAHVGRPGVPARSEWLSDGEEVVLMVPDACWGEHVTPRMRTFAASGLARKHDDPVLQQLLQLLARTMLDKGEAFFVASLIEAILMRGVLACTAARVATDAAREQLPLPAHRLARTRDFVQAHLAGPISLSDMARAAGLSPMHFAAQFRAATGMRPHDYLLEQRIQRAKQLMAETAYPLYDVALSVGFSTQAHFSTVFRKIAGTTPTRWRADSTRHGGASLTRATAAHAATPRATRPQPMRRNTRA